MTPPRRVFIGRWRITSIEGWEQPDVDLLGPAFIEFATRNDGEFQFSAVTGEIDYRVSVESDGPVVEWCWAGDDDGSETSGRGWATHEVDKLVGQIFIFGGDDFSFQALPFTVRGTRRSG